MPFITVTYPPKFPLTESEKSWLKGRQVLCPRCDCYRDHLKGTATCWDGVRKGWAVTECRMFGRKDVRLVDFEDAVKFEILVQKCLMRQYEKVVQCAEATGSFCPSRETMLMFARVEAEEAVEG